MIQLISTTICWCNETNLPAFDAPRSDWVPWQELESSSGECRSVQGPGYVICEGGVVTVMVGAEWELG